ncbi:hypothetical protein [Roseateles amylovorans]|jgi:hypothetical protein|uniref:Uncharacterized protein n=1 Tax=Roseateles amylovorans TaxID=2978473 RepID=A0ABY6B4D1_9BURK|nr:hypothetical protein [Roseateles amylovorans]UXH78393.1 hypothetical protein N4261_00150 [Roseateles amylovorans]
MTSIAMNVFLDSSPGELVDLPHAGSGLEHPLVFNSAAQEIHRLAAEGRAVVVQQRLDRVGEDPLICDLRFRRLA